MAKKETAQSKTIQQKIEQTKKLSIKEGAAYSFMDGFGLRYITPYALAVGANNFHIGLLSALPSLFGNLSQLKTFKYMEKYSRKKIVFWSVLLQSLMWLLLIAAGSIFFVFNIKNELAPYSVIIIYTILIFFGAFGGPAWTSWMRDIVSQEHRGNYFGRRSRIIGTMAIICLLLAGFILDYFKDTKIFIGFIILFSIAFLGRFVSALLFKRHYEPKFRAQEGYYFTIIDFIKKMNQNNFGRFVLFFALISFATAIASPFFAVYMLKDLGFSYGFYTLIILSSSLTSLIFLPAWGKFADKYGNYRVIKITGILIPLIPLFWVFTVFMGANQAHLLYYLLILEAFTGFAWAGFNLSAGNYIYDSVSRERLAICSSYFSVLSGIGVVIGSLLGGWIASMDFRFFGVITPILFVFILSGIMRLAVYAAISPKISEVRPVEAFGIKEAGRKIKTLSVHRFLDYMDIHFPRRLMPF